MQRKCTICIRVNVMTIKSILIFDKHEGKLVAFTDLGGANRDIKMLLNKLANHVLVLIVHAVFKPILSSPAAILNLMTPL